MATSWGHGRARKDLPSPCARNRAEMGISVDVRLISGRRAIVELEADASVETLRQRAQSALAVGRGRLLNSAGGFAFLRRAWFLSCPLQFGRVQRMVGCNIDLEIK